MLQVPKLKVNKTAIFLVMVVVVTVDIHMQRYFSLFFLLSLISQVFCSSMPFNYNLLLDQVSMHASYMALPSTDIPKRVMKGTYRKNDHETRDVRE